jgi:triosephosphate isomerase
MQNKLIAANFKMNKTNLELCEYFANFPEIPGDYRNKILFCVPATGLYFASNLISHPQISFGAENLHWQNSGAFTGEISAPMIVDCGAEFVIIGHSERRAYFFEDDEVVNKKVIAAIDNGLTAILCIGESSAERSEGRTKNVLSRQIDDAIRYVVDLSRLIIAYEPIWAIGANSPATDEQIQECVQIIHEILPEVPVIYGGSVNEVNAEEILSLPGIEGVLVGGACLDPDKFARICGLL